MIVDINEPASGTPLTITDAEFARFQIFVRETTGINLTDIKKALVVARLGNRVRHRKALSFAKYYKIITDPSESGELQIAIDLITTNETSFFREPTHFDILKEFIHSLRPLPSPFRVWSAASSSGEEAYSIAMVLADVMGAAEWEVLGSDISTRVLERARQGLYPLERSATIPKGYLQRFCLKGKENYEGMFLMGKALRDRTSFTQVNLCRPLPELGKFDVIFLRNILIYFNIQQKREVVESVLTKMKPHSLLIVGHSESLNGVTNRITAIRPTVYVPSESPPTFYLNPGDYVFANQRTRFRTILGSCVAVTFWHPERRLGAMCHYLLPTRAPEVPANPDGRYGDEILSLITERFLQQGLPLQEFHVKLFGGGNMFPSLATGDRFHIGDKNVIMGRSTLERAGFRILTQDVGHCLHRTVVFDIGTGGVWVRHSPSKCEMKCIFKPEEGCPHMPHS